MLDDRQREVLERLNTTHAKPTELDFILCPMLHVCPFADDNWICTDSPEYQRCCGSCPEARHVIPPELN